MGETTIEVRLAALETEVRELRESLCAADRRSEPWWMTRLGVFEGDEPYAQASRLAAVERAALPRASDGRLHP